MTYLKVRSPAQVNHNASSAYLATGVWVGRVLIGQCEGRMHLSLKLEGKRDGEYEKKLQLREATAETVQYIHSLNKGQSQTNHKGKDTVQRDTHDCSTSHQLLAMCVHVCIWWSRGYLISLNPLQKVKGEFSTTSTHISLFID